MHGAHKQRFLLDLRNPSHHGHALRGLPAGSWCDGFVIDCDDRFLVRLQHAGNTRRYCNTPLQAAANIPLETAAKSSSNNTDATTFD